MLKSKTRKGNQLYLKYFKPLFDYILALILLGLTLPLMAVIWLIVRLSMGSPVLFKQERAGQHGQPFTMYKFRSMAEPKQNEPRDHGTQRITSLGNFLRKSSLDELPQLFNIIKGEMSFIGPRPLFMHYIPRYSDTQKRRLDIKPGITGWAQVNGRNAITWEEKFKFDVEYVDNVSLLNDIKIYFLTLIKIFSTRQVNHSKDVAMQEFKGYCNE